MESYEWSRLLFCGRKNYKESAGIKSPPACWANDSFTYFSFWFMIAVCLTVSQHKANLVWLPNKSWRTYKMITWCFASQASGLNGQHQVKQQNKNNCKTWWLRQVLSRQTRWILINLFYYLQCNYYCLRSRVYHFGCCAHRPLICLCMHQLPTHTIRGD